MRKQWNHWQVLSFGAPADGDGRHYIKRHFFLGRKAVTNLDSMLKSTDITLPTKIHLVKAMFFPVVMYKVRWTIKKAECQRIDAFELWCWRRLLKALWAARSSNQSILKEISPEYSLEGLMLKLKLQYFSHWCEELTHLKRPWCLERLRAGGEGDDRGWDGSMSSATQWTWVWVDSGSWWWTERPGVLQFMGSQRVRHDWVTELNWLTLRDITPTPLLLQTLNKPAFNLTGAIKTQAWSLVSAHL